MSHTRLDVFVKVLQERLGLDVVRKQDHLVVTLDAVPLIIDLSGSCIEYVRILVFTARPESMSDAQLHQVAHDMARRIKVAKVVVSPESLVLSVEAVVSGEGTLPSSGQLAPLLRYLLLLARSGHEYLSEELILAGIQAAG